MLRFLGSDLNSPKDGEYILYIGSAPPQAAGDIPEHICDAQSKLTGAHCSALHTSKFSNVVNQEFSAVRLTPVIGEVLDR